MTDAKPYTKAQQVGRRERRTARVKKGRQGWARIILAKAGPCRVCVNATTNGHDLGRITFHHLVPKDWLGDDVEDNIVPLHEACHDAVTHLHEQSCKAMLATLSDAEYAYCVGKVGEGFAERIYGVVFTRG